MDKKLTDEIRRIGRLAGADDVGIADVETLRLLEPGANPERLLPGAGRIVLALVADPQLITEAGSPKEYYSMAYPGYQKADGAITSVAGALERAGYRTRFITRDSTITRDSRGRAMKTLPLKQAAQAAGLGTIGLNSLLVTRKWGPRVRLSGILTNAPLVAGEPLELELCDDCGRCKKECPAGAIPETGSSFAKCSAYLFSGINLNEVRDSISVMDFDALAKNGKRLLDSTSGWIASLASGRKIYYNCGKCVQVCDAHERLKQETKKKTRQS